MEDAVPHRFVNYLRVSTDRQCRSGLGLGLGLGLKAQRAAIAAYLAGSTRTLLDEMVEVESGTATASGRSSHARCRYAIRHHLGTQ